MHGANTVVVTALLLFSESRQERNEVSVLRIDNKVVNIVEDSLSKRLGKCNEAPNFLRVRATENHKYMRSAGPIIIYIPRLDLAGAHTMCNKLLNLMIDAIANRMGDGVCAAVDKQDVCKDIQRVNSLDIRLPTRQVET